MSDGLDTRVQRLEELLEMLFEDVQLPVGSYALLAWELGWGRAEIQRMLDIIEECNRKKDTSRLEARLTSELNINYQQVKLVILTLWHNHQFEWVCRDYAKNHKTAEFDHTGMY